MLSIEKLKQAILKFGKMASAFIIVLCVLYYYPYVKSIFFPNQMNHLEKIMRLASFKGFKLVVDRPTKSLITLTVHQNGDPITVRIFKRQLLELEPVDGNRVFFAHAVNKNDDGRYHLSKILFQTDPDQTKLIMLEITACGRIKNQTGHVKYHGHEPIYECEVPIHKITASAR